jgi:hypothetical protein
MRLTLAALGLLSPLLVTAQTYTDCNPTKKSRWNIRSFGSVTNSHQHVPLILHLESLIRRLTSQVHLMLSSQLEPSHMTQPMAQHLLFLSQAMAP